MTDKEIVEKLSERFCNDISLVDVIAKLSILDETHLKRLFDELEEMFASRHL
jgi:hypothetical protein